MNQLHHKRFCALRKMVAAEIESELSADGHCKPYEGAWELAVDYPNYFEDETATAKPNWYCIRLHCYVIGPGRHYEWAGTSWEECLTKCELDVDNWCATYQGGFRERKSN